MLFMQQAVSHHLKQMQRMMMSRQMKQAIHLLQMPVMELSSAIEAELENNPVLEYLEEDSDETLPETEEPGLDLDADAKTEEELQFEQHDLQTLRQLDEEFRDSGLETFVDEKNGKEQEKLHQFLENSIRAEASLFEYLMGQVKEALDQESDRELAEAIIGNFNENGFLSISLEELAVLQACEVAQLEKVLSMIQTFHPAGVGARDLRESLLIQLKLQGKEGTLAYRIIEAHFDDLLHNRILVIAKGLKCKAQEIREAIDRGIAKLDLHPGASFSPSVTARIIPEATIYEEEGQLTVLLHDDSLPPLRFNHRYLRMLEDPEVSKEDKEFIRQKILSAKWLMRNILQRSTTIERIAKELAQRQKTFFLDPNGQLVPMTMKVIAEALELHESTIARAVSSKYIDTPRGLLPLRFFFTQGIETQEGKEISSRSVKELIQEMIEKEDKSSPLSDEALAALIQAKGIRCARRTVAKYRTALNLGTSLQRRRFGLT